MATNEVVERDDICLMDTDELHEHLIEAGFSEETSSVIKGTIIDKRLSGYSYCYHNIRV